MLGSASARTRIPSPMRAARIAAHVKNRYYYAAYAVILFVSAVAVLRPETF